MRIPERGMRFTRITYHEDVTQCLGGLQTRPWYIVVSKPSRSVENYPQESDLVAFRIPHGVSIKMNMGTWHAGRPHELVVWDGIMARQCMQYAGNDNMSLVAVVCEVFVKSEGRACHGTAAGSGVQASLCGLDLV